MLTINLNVDQVPVNEVMERIEAELIKYVMEHSKFNQSRTAEQLGISRGTLRTKLDHYFPGVYL